MAPIPPKQMKAIQLQKFNSPYAVSQVPVPHPGPHQVLVKVKAGGFCHTECMVNENAFGSPLPVIGSHEPAGVVVEVGSDVREFEEGDRVGRIIFDSCCGESRRPSAGIIGVVWEPDPLMTSSPLGKCPDCRAGRPVYCDNLLMKGITADGAWAEYMVAYETRHLRRERERKKNEKKASSADGGFVAEIGASP